MKIADWLQLSTKTLSDVAIGSARLDCLLLLEHVLGKNRIFILSHDDQEVPDSQIKSLDELLARRKIHEPLAYITGTRDFYGRRFLVSPKVLIPRPETETIIELVLSLPLPKSAVIIDIGTGSGAIAVTTSLELQTANVIGYDIDPSAIAVAESNNTLLGGRVQFQVGDLLSSVKQPADCILANLPYVTHEQPVSAETQFEPAIALFANDDGLDLIYKLIDQISDATLQQKGFVVLESEPRQHDRIRDKAQKRGLDLLQTEGFIQLFQKT